MKILVIGFAHIFEGCRDNGIEHLVYASSSSVYGANTDMPFSVHLNVDHPLSLYAASKKANDLMDYIAALGKALGKTVEKQLLPLHYGNVPDTYADVSNLVDQFNYQPATTVEVGNQRFVAWYRNEFKLI